MTVTLSPHAERLIRSISHVGGDMPARFGIRSSDEHTLSRHELMRIQSLQNVGPVLTLKMELYNDAARINGISKGISFRTVYLDVSNQQRATLQNLQALA